MMHLNQQLGYWKPRTLMYHAYTYQYHIVSLPILQHRACIFARRFSVTSVIAAEGDGRNSVSILLGTHVCLLYIGVSIFVTFINKIMFTSLYLWKFHSLHCCLLNQEACCSPLLYLASLLLPPPTHPWRKLAQQHKTP